MNVHFYTAKATTSKALLAAFLCLAIAGCQTASAVDNNTATKVERMGTSEIVDLLAKLIYIKAECAAKGQSLPNLTAFSGYLMARLSDRVGDTGARDLLLMKGEALRAGGMAVTSCTDM